MNLRLASAVALLSLWLAVAGTAGAAGGDYETARNLTRDAFAADDEGHHAEATGLLRQALALRPNHPGLLFAAAQTSASEGNSNGSLDFLNQIAGLSVTANLSRAEALNALKSDPRYDAIASAIEDNARASGSAARTFQASQTLLLVEGIAFDAARDRFFLSSIHDRAIVSVSRDGNVTAFADASSGLFSPTGMKVDEARGLLIVASAATPQTPELDEGDKGKSAVLAFDLETGALRHAWTAGAGKHWFGDVTLGKDGTIYISDSLQQELYVIRDLGDVIETLVAHADFPSPQGITLSDDGSFLYLADYAMGLFRIDLTTKEILHLMPSADLAPYGIDGLYFHRGNLIAIQNGVRPNRIIRIKLADGGARIEGTKVLVAAHEDFLEPTLGVLDGDTFHFVANSGWPHFGKPPVDADVLRTELPATVVLEIELDE